VPVSPEVVRSKLLDIEEAVEPGLHIAAEAVFATGNHILAGEFQEAADEDREIPPRLVARGVLGSSTAKRLESLAGFSNVLVHDYAAVDVRRVHAGLARLEDFEAFVAAIETWLARTSR